MLLKQADERGFVFYTNYGSQKAQELEANPQASLVFYWPQLERQVRVEGPVSRVTAAESDEYFQTRPRESQIGALASPQSEVISGREFCNSALQNWTNSMVIAKSSVPLTGAVIACIRNESNSGRAVPAACMIVCFTHSGPTVLGPSNASRLET